MIALMVLDIDGVITDGREQLLDRPADSPKQISYIDMDAVHAARKQGMQFALLTAEDNSMARQIANRFGIKALFAGYKDKRKGLEEIAAQFKVGCEAVCFVGDANRDALAFDSCGVSFAPSNATAQAKISATFALHRAGGAGAVAEAIDVIFKLKRMAA